jgi:DME family drug/metabolite transporter
VSPTAQPRAKPWSSPHPPPAQRGLLLVLAAALLWSLLGPFSRSLQSEGLGALEIAFWRAALAGALFAAHATVSGRWRLGAAGERGWLAMRDALALALFALVGVTLFYASLNMAIATGGISLAFVLLYTAPAFVVVLAWPLLRETPSWRTGALVVVTLLGVGLVSVAGGGRGVTVSAAAVLWGLTSGAAYASYYLFGKWILHRYAPVTIFAWVMPMGALGLLPLVSFAPERSLWAWFWIALMALLSTYVAYALYYAGLRLVTASRAVLVATIEPVAAAAWAALFFGERLSAWGWLGAALVVAAATLTTARNR